MTWPFLNRADSLTVDFFYLQRQVGQQLGYGPNPALWNDTQIQIVQECIDSGCRTYYFPPPLGPPYVMTSSVGAVHEWSFMRPVMEFDTVANTRRYALPENFERPIGSITFRAGNTLQQTPIMFTSTQKLLEYESQQNFTAPPQLASIEPMSMDMDGVSPQTLQLTLHPTPDAVYELQLQYQAHASRVTSDSPYPLGGQMHGPGILAACLAEAEARTSGQGQAWNRFMQILAGNILRDEKRGPAILGYNGDGYGGYDGRGDYRRANLLYYNLALYGNTSYPGA